MTSAIMAQASAMTNHLEGLPVAETKRDGLQKKLNLPNLKMNELHVMIPDFIPSGRH